MTTPRLALLLASFALLDLAAVASAQSGPLPYCTSGISSIGCLPQMTVNVQPNVTGTSGCVISTLGLEGQKLGLTFYGLNNSGFTPTPWAPASSSYLCVKAPTARIAIANTGGTAGQCNGSLAMNWDAYQLGNPTALGAPWSAGTKLFVQSWYRDPLAPRGTNLSDAVELTVRAITPVPCVSPLPGMRLIANGAFQMGSNATFTSPYFSFANEKPVRTVSLTQCFWMGQHEVTQAEYIAVMGSLPRAPAFAGANRPVENVSWIEARAYCATLTAQQAAQFNIPFGYEYRLPTEAEWEYVCRAGTTSEFHYGPALACADARQTYSYHPGGNCGVNSTTVVESYAPNPWGLFDLHGNVSEWCLDTFANYAPGPATNPFVSVGVDRIVRGGSWADTSSNCRSAARSWGNPFLIYNSIGFRVVLAPIIVVP
ncbi:MAG: formylglycine-generating enzyme family protein [Planctomycetota bacterium]|nr:formylglycine-generating enzyme family protein [Planctomycetota bacterium]